MGGNCSCPKIFETSIKIGFIEDTDDSDNGLIGLKDCSSYGRH